MRNYGHYLLRVFFGFSILFASSFSTAAKKPSITHFQAICAELVAASRLEGVRLLTEDEIDGVSRKLVSEMVPEVNTNDILPDDTHGVLRPVVTADSKIKQRTYAASLLKGFQAPTDRKSVVRLMWTVDANAIEDAADRLDTIIENRLELENISDAFRFNGDDGNRLRWRRKLIRYTTFPLAFLLAGLSHMGDSDNIWHLIKVVGGIISFIAGATSELGHIVLEHLKFDSEFDKRLDAFINVLNTLPNTWGFSSTEALLGDSWRKLNETNKLVFDLETERARVQNKEKRALIEEILAFMRSFFRARTFGYYAWIRSFNHVDKLGVLTSGIIAEEVYQEPDGRIVRLK